MAQHTTSPSLKDIGAYYPDSKDLIVIVETPKGSRNKYTYSERYGLFELKGALPAGASFPFDFGFIPSTLGGDGDPLDVLLLMDEAAFPGCLVRSRLIGAVEAEQTERGGETTRNDRLIAAAADSLTRRDVRTLKDLSLTVIEEIEHFFISYNDFKGKVFKPLRRSGAKRAEQLVRAARRAKSDAE